MTEAARVAITGGGMIPTMTLTIRGGTIDTHASTVALPQAQDMISTTVAQRQRVQPSGIVIALDRDRL